MKESPRVCIIDYGVGNIASVGNALNFLGVDFFVSSSPDKISESSHLILPGVGSFGDGMQNLKERGLVDVVRREALVNKKDILGICLGMQLFASIGFEYGEHRGLNLVKGQVVKIDNSVSGFRLPHVGWNGVKIRKGYRISRRFQGDPIFYFVHSYHFIPEDIGVVAGVCNYGHDMVAMIESDNIFGAQFHPEKSDTDGLIVFKNFLNID